MKRMKYFGATALLALLAACSNDDMENVSYQDDPLAVRITATAGKNVITRSNPTTDDASQSAFKENDRISVGTDDQEAVIYKLGSTGWSPESGYLKWTTSSLTFNAYYPVGENNASMTTFNVPVSQNSLDAIEKADYMTYSSNVSKPATASESITLTLERKMARVVIGDIKFLDQYETGYKVTAITVHGNTSGYENGTMKTGDISVESYYKAEEEKFYALLSPTTQDDAATFLTVTVKPEDAPDTEKGTELTVKGIPALVASNSYTYTLTVGKDMIAVSSVTVNEWNDGGSVIANGGEGEAEEWTEGPDASTHTIKASEAGQIASNLDWITTAIGEGNSLTISGKINDADLVAIKSWLDDNTDKTLELNLANTDLTTFERGRFAGYSNLIGITFPQSLTDLGATTFSRSGLTTVDVPASVTMVQEAFSNCSSLKEIHIRGAVTYCYAFCIQCSALTDIYFYNTSTPPQLSTALIFMGVNLNNLKIT